MTVLCPNPIQARREELKQPEDWFACLVIWGRAKPLSEFPISSGPRSRHPRKFGLSATKPRPLLSTCSPEPHLKAGPWPLPYFLAGYSLRLKLSFLNHQISFKMGKKPAGPAYVLGVGMTKFIKPRGKVDYNELGFEAGVKAMLDAKINYDEVDQGVACYVYGDSTCGQRVFYQFGLTQIPVYNVNNNCSTGSTGLAMARTLVSHGAADCVLVVGFEKMSPGSLQSVYNDRANPTGLLGMMMAETRGITNAPGAAQMFGNAGREYIEK